MRNAVAVTAVTVIALAVGWYIGRTTAVDISTESRIASLEREVTTLKEAGEPAAFRPGAVPVPGAPPTAQQARRPDPTVRHEIAVDGAPTLGPKDARITIVEFSDFQCPFCGRSAPTMNEIRKAYPGQVRIVFKHLPLPMHPNARPAAIAAEAAHRQGKFWEMHDKIFANQSSLSAEQFAKYAQELGLDLDRFRKDVAAAETNARISADEQEASKLGVSGTPSFFVNGMFQPGALPFEMFKAMIDEELKSNG